MKFIINLLILFVLIINSSYADDELITLEELRSLDSKIDNIEVSEIYKDILEVYSLNNLIPLLANLPINLLKRYHFHGDLTNNYRSA